MRNCFNNILIALNICDSLHLIFAIMDAVRNSFGEKNFRIICWNIMGKVQTPSCNCLKKCFQDFRKCECWCTITSDKEKLVKNGNFSCRCNTMCFDENSWKDKEFCKKHPWDTRLSKCQKLLNIEHISNTDEKQPAPLFGGRNCVFFQHDHNNIFLLSLFATRGALQSVRLQKGKVGFSIERKEFFTNM